MSKNFSKYFLIGRLSMFPGVGSSSVEALMQSFNSENWQDFNIQLGAISNRVAESNVDSDFVIKGLMDQTFKSYFYLGKICNMFSLNQKYLEQILNTPGDLKWIKLGLIPSIAKSLNPEQEEEFKSSVKALIELENSENMDQSLNLFSIALMLSKVPELEKTFEKLSVSSEISEDIAFYMGQWTQYLRNFGDNIEELGDVPVYIHTLIDMFCPN